MCREENLISIVFSTIEEFAPQRNGLLTLMCSMCGSQRGMRLFVAVNEAVNNALFHANRDLPEACVELVAVDEGFVAQITVYSQIKRDCLFFICFKLNDHYTVGE